MTHKNLFTGLKGMAMGMAEVVPGVSGGTIAFVTNIYERLIEDIKRLSGLPIGVWKKEGFSAFWKHIDGSFLLALMTGMVSGIVVGVFGITYLLDHFPAIIWGFFFGLIIASAIYIGRKIKSWSIAEILMMIVGIVIAYFITVVSPSHGSENLLFVFISGMIAICALILPGISGSFILLLMGMYPIVLHSAKDLMTNFSTGSLMIILVFLLGCVTGLVIFANMLNYLFKKFHYPTLALLTGFMLGSLNRIWPWRNPVTWLNKESGEFTTVLPPGIELETFHIVEEMNVWPANYEGTPYLLGVLISFVFGLAIVWFLSKVE